MSDQQNAEFVLQFEELDFSETVAAGQALRIAAEALENLGKYPRSVSFVRAIVAGLYDKAMAKAQAEELKPQRPWPPARSVYGFPDRRPNGPRGTSAPQGGRASCRQP